MVRARMLDMVRLTQDDEVVERYRKGRELTIGLSAEF